MHPLVKEIRDLPPLARGLINRYLRYLGALDDYEMRPPQKPHDRAPPSMYTQLFIDMHVRRVSRRRFRKLARKFRRRANGDWLLAAVMLSNVADRWYAEKHGLPYPTTGRINVYRGRGYEDL